MEASEITVDDVAVELERCIREAAAKDANGEIDYSKGLTAPEISEKIGRHVKWVRKQLKKGLENGTIVLGFTQRLTMLSRKTTVPVYRPRRDTNDG